MPEIHISDIRTFKSCRRKWEWASPLKGNLEPIIPYVPFFTGRAFHAALEYKYRDGIPFEDTLDTYFKLEEGAMDEIAGLWPGERAAFDEQIELVRSMIDHYAMWQAQDTRVYSDRNLEFVSLEQGFEIPLPAPDGGFHPTATLAGRFDGVVRHTPTDTFWLWETKTTRSIAELTNSLVNDEQCGVYAYAASQVLQKPIAGVLYNMVRKKAPSLPRILQNGQLSKAVSIDTTAFHYLSEIKSQFPDYSDDTILDEYGDTLAALQANETKFFLRFPVYRTPAEIANLLRDIYHVAVDMLNPDTPLYPAPSWLNCNFCSFKSACITRNADGDYGTLLDAEFRVRQSAVSMKEVPDEV